MKQGKNLNDALGFENYLKVVNELMKLDFEAFMLNFKVPFEYKGMSIDKFYYNFVHHLLNMYLYNNIYIYNTLKRVYVLMKMEVEGKKYTTIPVLPALAEFQKGKVDGTYKTLESFNERCIEHLIDPQTFKYIYATFCGFRRGFDRKIGVPLA